MEESPTIILLVDLGTGNCQSTPQHEADEDGEGY
jgi:hypothetical protein